MGEYGEAQKLPEQFRHRQISDLMVGESAYVDNEAIWCNEQWQSYIDASITLGKRYEKPAGNRSLLVYRLPEGFVVDIQDFVNQSWVDEDDIYFVREMFSDEEDDERSAQDQIPVVMFINNDTERKNFLKEFRQSYALPFVNTKEIAKSVAREKRERTASTKKAANKHSKDKAKKA